MGEPVPCPGSGVVLAGDPPWVVCRECGVQTGTEDVWPFGRLPRVRVIDHSELEPVQGFDHSETR